MLALPHGTVVVVVALQRGLSKASTSWKCFQEIYKAAAARPVVPSLYDVWLWRGSLKTTDLILGKPEAVSVSRLEINIEKLFTAIELDFLLCQKVKRDLSAAASSGFIFGVFLAGVILCLWEFAEVSFLCFFTECHSRQWQGSSGWGKICTWKCYFSSFQFAMTAVARKVCRCCRNETWSCLDE